MLPDFLVEETTVRESGESAVFDIGQDSRQSVDAHFGHHTRRRTTTHSAADSRIGGWPDLGAASAGCISAEMLLRGIQAHAAALDMPYLKAVWRAVRWGRNEQRPFFRFYVFADVAHARAATRRTARPDRSHQLSQSASVERQQFVQPSTPDVAGHEGFTISALPNATRSNSPRSNLASSSSIPVTVAVSSDPNDFIRSSLSVTEPTVMVGFPVSFFVQPARFRLLPANSGSQNRRVEQ